VRSRFIGSYQELDRQADKFAAYLLMPGYLVRREWADVYGTDAPFEVTPKMEAVGRKNFGSKAEFFNALAASKSKPLADRFGVSVPAMRIQLQELRLLPRP
jgi:Zn-dependent peptidase ImmA (M78 family)